MLVSLLVMSALVQDLTLATGQANLTLYAVADNYVDSKYPELAHYGKSPTLYVGNSYDHAQDIWGSERIYIRFNLTGIPENRVIEQATLRLWQFYAPKWNQNYETHRVLGDWNETAQNWNTQPSWDLAVTSQVIAPNQREVAVEWEITTDVRAWYKGEARNFGTMIKVVEEEHVQDASSGFWSREYPVEEWKPRLVITFQSEPILVYSVTLSVAGLPSGSAAAVTVDGQPSGFLRPGELENMTFARETIHKIAVSDLMSGPPNVRYRCYANETQVSSATALIFVYSAEFYVNVTSPIGRTEGSGWYANDTVASFSVDRSTVPAEGFLGMLGLRHSLVEWVGSDNFLGVPAGAGGSLVVREPTAILAVWQEGWDSALFNIAFLLALIALAGVALILWASKRRGPRRPSQQVLTDLPTDKRTT